MRQSVASFKPCSLFSEKRAVAGKSSLASCAETCENELWLYSCRRRGRTLEASALREQQQT